MGDTERAKRVVISEEEAYSMWLESSFDGILPFRSKFEADFIGYLDNMGYEVRDGEAS